MGRDDYVDYDAEIPIIDEPEENWHKPTKEEVRQKIIIGFLGELYIKYKLRDEGCDVCKLVYTDSGMLREKPILNFLSGYLGNKEELMQLLKDNIVGIPDYICRKGDHIFFVEVKSNTSKLKGSQLKTIAVLKGKGYEVDVHRVEIDGLKVRQIEDTQVQIDRIKDKNIRKRIAEEYFGELKVLNKYKNEIRKIPDYHERVGAIKEMFSRAYESWTEEEEEELFQLFRERKELKEISEILRRQPSAVRKRMEVLGFFE